MSLRVAFHVMLGSILLMMTSLGKAAPAPTSKAAPLPTNTDEALVVPYTLPDPLKFPAGSPVANAADWVDRRRPQILTEFTELMFGKAPPAPKKIEFKIVSQNDQALGGKAIRKEIEITLAEQPQPVRMTMLLYVPKSGQPAAAFWGLNFWGNHSVTAETDVRLNPNWIDNHAPGVVDHRATEASRGRKRVTGRSK